MITSVISIDTASAITELSRSTWWRRISAKAVTCGATDDRGRVMLLWGQVEPHLSIAMNAEDQKNLFLADTGAADAQNEMGQLFLSAAKYKAAFYWFQQASKQDHPDAMQWLGYCYMGGKGVEKNDYLGLMWVAKAAALGHEMAQGEIQRLIRHTLKNKPGS